MPMYEFFCRDCNKNFELQMRIYEFEKNKDQQTCPYCENSNVERKIPDFGVQTSKKS